MHTPEQIFETGLLYHHYANTAYPLTPGSFAEYRITDRSLVPSFLQAEWQKADRLSLYIHIPFCAVRCRFCEYVVLDKSDAATEAEYTDLLLREIALYQPLLAGKRFAGYDLGGGTPTRLAVPELLRITHAVRQAFDFDDDVVFSVETTPAIAAREPEKLLALHQMGYQRISMGIQTISEKLLNELGREGTTHVYEQAVHNIRAAGYRQFNIDLMYGFLNQTREDFEHTIRYAMQLAPEYITLYRNRYKGTKLEDEAGGVSLYKIIAQYQLAYRLLNEGGYRANPGKNTFSRIDNDYGTSSYLTARVIDGTPYVGLGLGAQSFGVDYLAYNDGAASKQLQRYRERVLRGEFPLQDLYALPPAESMSKMLSVAFYFGFIDKEAFRKRFGQSLDELFEAELEFLFRQQLAETIGQRVYLTERGADYINGIIPLFYSPRAKAELVALYTKSLNRPDGEAEFLKAYRIGRYARPSLAADVVLVGQTDQPDSSSILLIRRGEHPSMNRWALPGGFVRTGETAEQAAERELREEAGLHVEQLQQFRLFSEPNRDPRGWIVSCAFHAQVPMLGAIPRFGDDAIDAQWFDAQLRRIASDTHVFCYQLELSHANIRLSATLASQNPPSHATLEVIENTGLAFDHAAIVAHALLHRASQG